MPEDNKPEEKKPEEKKPVATAPQEGQDEEPGFLEKNKGGVIGGALLAILGFMMGGPLGGLIGMLLGFLGGNAMFPGDKGGDKGGTNTPAGSQKSGDSPEQSMGKVRLLDKDGKPINAGKDGEQIIEVDYDIKAKDVETLLAKNNPAMLEKMQKDPAFAKKLRDAADNSDVKTFMVGKVDADGQFIATRVVQYAKGGEGKDPLVVDMKLPQPTRMGTVKDGEMTLSDYNGIQGEGTVVKELPQDVTAALAKKKELPAGISIIDTAIVGGAVIDPKSQQWEMFKGAQRAKQQGQQEAAPAAPESKPDTETDSSKDKDDRGVINLRIPRKDNPSQTIPVFAATYFIDKNGKQVDSEAKADIAVRGVYMEGIGVFNFKEAGVRNPQTGEMEHFTFPEATAAQIRESIETGKRTVPGNSSIGGFYFATENDKINLTSADNKITMAEVRVAAKELTPSQPGTYKPFGQPEKTPDIEILALAEGRNVRNAGMSTAAPAGGDVAPKQVGAATTETGKTDGRS